MEQDAGLKVGYSEQDLLRKKALKGAFGVTSVRDLGYNEEYLEEINEGLEFCDAFTKGVILHSAKFPISVSDIPVWQAFEKVVSGTLVEKAGIDALSQQADRVRHILSSLSLQRETIQEGDLLECERFFLRVAMLLE